MQKLTFELKFLFLYAVNVIPDYGMTEMLRMHAYLVRSARMQIETAQSITEIPFNNFIVGHGKLAFVRRHYRHFQSVGGTPADVSRNYAFVGFQVAFQ